MITVENLSKRYGNVSAITEVSFSVARGEVLAFLGPNGAGKTTTMRILTGFVPPTSGTARVAGFDVLDQPLEVKRRIGYLPDNPPLYMEMTVGEYLAFAAKIRGVRGKAVSSARAAVLEKCGLAGMEGRLIANLSRGYRQRVGLAQAMIHNPEVLILDEPTVGLDPKQIVEIRELIKTLGGERTVILSTHILPEATAVCQKVVIINKGRIVAVDAPDRLAMRTRKSEKTRLCVRRGEAVEVAAIFKIQGVTHVAPHPASPSETDPSRAFIIESEVGTDIREALADTVVRAGWGLLEMQPQVATIEDVFLQLTTQEGPIEASSPAMPTVAPPTASQ